MNFRTRDRREGPTQLGTPENARFDHTGMTFVTLNVAGTNNSRDLVLGDDLAWRRAPQRSGPQPEASYPAGVSIIATRAACRPPSKSAAKAGQTAGAFALNQGGQGLADQGGLSLSPV